MRIQSIYDNSGQIYGAGKITAILQNQGVKTSKKYVSQLMKELGISSVSTNAKKEYKKWVILKFGMLSVSCPVRRRTIRF